jgi:hypothetical protein
MRRIPPAVRAAVAGDGRPLVLLKLAALASGSGADERVSEFDAAVFVATTCEESTLAWDPAAAPPMRRLQARGARSHAGRRARAVRSRRRAGLRPAAGVRELAGARARRRAGAAAAGERADARPVRRARPAHPAGERPLLATSLRGRLVVERDVGHAVLGADPNGCAPSAVEAFLAGRPPPACRREAVITLRGRATHPASSAAATAAGASSVNAWPAPGTMVSDARGNPRASLLASATNFASRLPASTATGIATSSSRDHNGAMTPVPIPRSAAARCAGSLRSRSARAAAATSGT